MWEIFTTSAQRIILRYFIRVPTKASFFVNDVAQTRFIRENHYFCMFENLSDH